MANESHMTTAVLAAEAIDFPSLKNLEKAEFFRQR